MPTISHYQLSLKADQDLEDIYEYSKLEFSTDQAVKYLTEFEDLFNQLVQNPKMGKERSEIKIGLRSFPRESHIVFYRIMKDRIRIVRILHARKDFINFKE